MKLIVSAVAQTPLSFRTGRNNTEAATFDYIPGGTLLGALVNAHGLMHNRPAELERWLFQDSTQISNLYPANLPDDMTGAQAQKLAPLDDHRLPVYPFPATAHSCKRFPGFVSDAPSSDDPDAPPAGDPHHGMRDHLIFWSLFCLSGKTNLAVLQAAKKCAFSDGRTEPCGEERSPQTGFYRRGPAADQWISFKVKELLRTHTGVNRTTGTVQEGILFSRSVIAEGRRFWGAIQIDDAVAADFRAFMAEASEAGLLRVGGGRSRGLGRIQATTTDDFQAGDREALAGRLETFNQKLRDMAQTYEIDLKDKHRLYLPLTLTADAIILDRLLRYYTYLSPDYLEEAWQIEAAELIYSNARARQVMGWNSLWRLPKPDELALGMGAVFLFGLARGLDDDLVDKLWTLQTTGVGVRRREGFGQLLVADPFHWEANSPARNDTDDENLSPARPRTKDR